jgi:hypothetical protein
MSNDDESRAPPALLWPIQYGNISQIASAVVACAAFGGILLQLNLLIASSELTRTNAEVANARQVYLAYNDAALKYPQYADPDYPTIKADPVKLAQYRNYVSMMLWAYDEILMAAPSQEWLAGFEYDLPPHLPFLCDEQDLRFDAMFHAAMRARLAKARQGCPATGK